MVRQRILPVLVAAVAGTVAVLVTLVVSGWRPGADRVDGEFVLTEPGIFSEPVEDVNADRSGDRLPEMVLTDRTGAAVPLSSYRGTPMVVNLWFSNCAPCRRELRDFATVHAEVGDRIAFVGVDPFDTAETMVAFAEERGVTYDLLRDTGDLADDRLLTDELGIVAYPVTLFVDADGVILRQTGELTADELRAAIEELF